MFNDPVENRIPNVEGLKLVGVLESDGGANRALFEDKSGFSYILQTGDKVRNGYVLRVDEDQVYFQIFEYGWSRTVALTMEY
jgi:Tfp pilus assembly protein PilP